jgi:hypothetical protein
MCCVTHPYRDQLDRALAERQGALPAFEALQAPCEDFRCRCALTAEPCRRKATGEDLNCDWCRQTDHAAWARANLPVSLGGGADVRRPGPSSVRFEIPTLPTRTVSALVGSLTPAEIKSVLGLPKL